MDKLFVATLSNYFEKKNEKISKITTFPTLFKKPKLPLQKILEKYQNK
jgi:hypothetical protein